MEGWVITLLLLAREAAAAAAAGLSAVSRPYFAAALPGRTPGLGPA
ncbi:MAG: hypothetical protein RI601_09035 [Desulfurivibrionaceae bacterium]|nr:hypothetical protein [Desulfurivibrionaceae bacterium]